MLNSIGNILFMAKEYRQYSSVCCYMNFYLLNANIKVPEVAAAPPQTEKVDTPIPPEDSTPKAPHKLAVCVCVCV